MRISLLSLFLIVLRTHLSDGSSKNSLGQRLSVVWSGLWNIGCSLLPPGTSRKMRSTQMDTKSPREIFDYLFPLAKVEKVEELFKVPNGPRDTNRAFFNSPPSPFVAAWYEDMMEVFISECYPNVPRKRSRKSRSHVRVQGKLILKFNKYLINPSMDSINSPFTILLCNCVHFPHTHAFPSSYENAFSS